MQGQAKLLQDKRDHLASLAYVSKDSEQVCNKAPRMKIVHIHQSHKVPFGMPSNEYIDKAVQSQFRVAQALKKYKDSPILIEGLYEDMSSENLDESFYIASFAARKIFPRGVPKDFNKLDPIQKDFLYENGADFTLLYLGEISKVCKSIHKEASDAIDRKVLERKSIGGTDLPRELEAISCAKEAAYKHFGKLDNATIVIVFGAAHDFKSLCDKEGIEYIVENREIVPVPEDAATLMKFTLSASSQIKSLVESRLAFEYYQPPSMLPPIEQADTEVVRLLIQGKK